MDEVHNLPRNVVRKWSESSTVKSLDFHPFQKTLLLVGTSIGDVTVWEVVSWQRTAYRNFKIWDLNACSTALQASMICDGSATVNRVRWSPDGTLLGVAYSKHIVHIYSYHDPNNLSDHLEIEAHDGSANDLAFSYPNRELCIVTCGEDRLIKVWDAVTGSNLYTLEGHESPVYSVCPHHKENIQFIFSTATDGNIKAWLYNNLGPRVNYDAPGHCPTVMAYSANGSRLFSCGTNSEGESFLIKWNDDDGAVKRRYLGLGRRSMGVVQFDTTRNRFLAVAGDEFSVKFWDMDDVNLLCTVNAGGGSLVNQIFSRQSNKSPLHLGFRCLRFNKEGTLMAVSSDNIVNIVANTEGVELLRQQDSRS